MNASIAQAAHQDLIPVFQADIGGILVNACDARTLHKFLEVGKDFSTWIKARIKQYGFAENSDYITIPKMGDGEKCGLQEARNSIPQNGGIKKGRGGDLRSIEYTLTLDMGKELSMVEKNEKGRQARKYFINCERLAIEALTKNQYGLKQLPEPPTITKAQQGILFNKVVDIAAGRGQIRSQIWSRFQNHFKLNSYKNLPADQFDDATAYLKAKQYEYNNGAEMMYVSNFELAAMVDERVKAIEGELLPHHANDKILSEEDWACLFVVHEETQHLITDLKPVIDMLSSVTLLHVPLYLKNLQTVTDKLHSRFGEQMDEAAEKTGLFARKNWQPVPDAVKLDGELPAKPEQHNSITLNLAPITDGKMKRLMVTQHPEGRVDFWALTPEQKTFTESEYIECLQYKGYIVAKKDEYYIMERKDKVSAGKLVLDYIPTEFLPYMIEVAGQLLGRVEAGKVKA